MTGWLQDVRYALRQLLKARAFTQTAVLLAAPLSARRVALVEARLCGSSHWRLGRQQMEVKRTE